MIMPFTVREMAPETALLLTFVLSGSCVTGTTSRGQKTPDANLVTPTSHPTMHCCRDSETARQPCCYIYMLIATQRPHPARETINRLQNAVNAWHPPSVSLHAISP